jgi:hypothetical protein
LLQRVLLQQQALQLSPVPVVLLLVPHMKELACLHHVNLHAWATAPEPQAPLLYSLPQETLLPGLLLLVRLLLAEAGCHRHAVS